MTGDGTAGDAEQVAREAVEQVARDSYGRLMGYLAAGTRDLAGAQDALGEAFVAALRTWPARGVPDHPDSWLLTAARRTLVDAARRRDVATRSLPGLARLTDAATSVDAPEEPVADDAIPDTRLALLFTCAHPAIDAAVRSPLMLQTVLGLDAARIAAAFLVSPTAMGQRLVRAKAKIKLAGIPFVVPGPEHLPGRRESVLEAIYAAYGAGWEDPTGRDGRRQGLTREAVRLARLVTELLPGEPEAHGLLAALLHSEAREAARRDADGSFVPLADQDMRSWSPQLMAEAETHLARAYSYGAAGPYQVLAAIQSAHNRRAVTGRTDWAAIAALYDLLVDMTPSIGAHVARAAAHLHAGDARTASGLLDELDPTRVAGYQPYWVVRAHCLHLTGNPGGADRAGRVALGLTEDPALRHHLLRTFAGWQPPDRDQEPAR